MALGDFTPSVMPKLIGFLEEAWPDSLVGQRQNNLPFMEDVRLIKAQETASWESVRPNDRKCEEFDVTWLEESDNDATVTTGVDMIHRPKCAIAGEEVQSKKQTYKVDTVIQHGVKIKDEDCGNMFSFNSKVAFSLLQGQKKLLAKLAATLPSWIDAYAGPNLAEGVDFMGNIGTEDANDPFTAVAVADLDADKLLPYLTMMAQLNNFQEPFILDGALFWSGKLKAEMVKGTYAGDVGEANYWNLFPYANDAQNMLKAGLLNSAFVIERGVLALPIVSFFPRLGNDNEVKADKYIYSIPLAGVTLGGQPIYIDVTYTKAEEQIGSTGRCQLVHTFDMELKTKLWLAPKYTSDTRTGVIKLSKAA